MDDFSIEPESRAGKLRLAPSPYFTQTGVLTFDGDGVGNSIHSGK
ncbi:hypothetical protein C943_03796 [Mariniradius saccharolyticus AK6]|uniref:Uncharacterized protein n=1 Tax=Mariniradius saccharolyticus AK6 TaxID=1239962 RepID=M7X999_9BACT|nr:hypothetical protein C943_03796 [Mariniradius saccharolyticus AK6]